MSQVGYKVQIKKILLALHAALFCYTPLRAGFCWWGPGANIEDGSSLIIHWSIELHKRSTNWANQYDIYFDGAPTGPLDPPPKSNAATTLKTVAPPITVTVS